MYAITGAGGQLGRELCRQLGSKALSLARPEFDITDTATVRRVLLEQKPEAVINTAAYTLVDRAEQEIDRCWEVNAHAVGTLATVCRELNCPLVQVSSDYVFDADVNRTTPHTEAERPAPQGQYARSKLAGEERAAEWSRHFVIRTCGLYGERGPRSSGNFVDTMLRLGREKPSLRVVGDQHCTPSYVPHVARAILFLLRTDAYGTHHVVNRGETTWYDFAAEIFRLRGMNVELERITTEQYGAPAPRPRYSVLDTSKYQALGGPEMPEWEVSLAEYLGKAEKTSLE
jgi:dTDP-4-dehydrorhamnose reductase